MGIYELKLPQMGESIEEASLIKWFKNVGDKVEVDDAIVEIATDKVDSDVPSDVSGTLVEQKVNEGDTVKIGQVIGLIETSSSNNTKSAEKSTLSQSKTDNLKQPSFPKSFLESEKKQPSSSQKQDNNYSTPNVSQLFYSPLIKTIAEKEKLSNEDLLSIKGTGLNGRIVKSDIFKFIQKRQEKSIDTPIKTSKGDKIIELDRMEKILADHMIKSKKTSAHVQSFLETDVTKLWDWRAKNKTIFKDETLKLTFTPLFIAAVAKALVAFPKLNSSLEAGKIIQKENINIGMATSLPNNKLIVPVIKNADKLSLSELAFAVNDLAQKARNNKLAPSDIENGTYTLTNIGASGAIAGTPIINQPQVGILAIGNIRKLPSVVETEEGDKILIRKKMILTHSYDHRIINGVLGGLFAKKISDYLENVEELLEGIL